MDEKENNEEDNEEEYRYGRRGMRGGMSGDMRGNMHGGMNAGRGMGARHGMMHGMMNEHHYGMAFGRRGALRPIVLSLLSESPKSGAELADAIESMYDWRPSSGSLYPLMDELESEKIVKKSNDKYELVEKLDRQDFLPMGFGRPMSTYDIINRIDSWVEYFESMKKRNPKGFEAYADKLKELSTRLAGLTNK